MFSKRVLNMARAFFFIMANGFWNRVGFLNFGDENASVSDQAGQLSGSTLDPFGQIAGIYNDFMGFTAQNAEFVQQNQLLEKQQNFAREQMEFYSEPEKMRRMKEAGINPALAAGSLAGSSSVPSAGSAPSVPSSAGAAGSNAAGLMSAASNAGLSLSEIDKNKADALFARENAGAVNQRVRNETLDVAARLIPALMSGGLSEIGASLVGLNIANGGIDKVLEYLQAYDGCREFDVKLKTLEHIRDQEKDKADKMLESLSASISEAEAAAARDNASARKDAADASFQEGLNKLYEEYPYMRLPGAMQFVYVGNKYGFESAEYINLGHGIKDFSYYGTRGDLEAQVESAFDLEKNKGEGANAVLAETLRIQLQNRMQMLLQDKQYQEELAKIGLKTDSAGKLFDVLLKYLFGTGFSVNVGKVGVTNSKP